MTTAPRLAWPGSPQEAGEQLWVVEPLTLLLQQGGGGRGAGSGVYPGPDGRGARRLPKVPPRAHLDARPPVCPKAALQYTEQMD